MESHQAEVPCSECSSSVSKKMIQAERRCSVKELHCLRHYLSQQVQSSLAPSLMQATLRRTCQISLNTIGLCHS